MYSISIAFGVISQGLGVNSKAYGDNSKGYGDKTSRKKSLSHIVENDW